MQKITPHLWFDKEAKEATEFYALVFPHSKITNITTLHDTPSGDCDIVSFTLSGQSFMVAQGVRGGVANGLDRSNGHQTP